MTLSELCDKQIIDLTTGSNLGHADDAVVSPETAQITHLVIYGRLKLFGLLGREKDTLLPWQDIHKVGRDALLVNTKVQLENEPKQRHLQF